VLGTLLSTMYLFRGGLRSIVITERVQFVLMFGGFAVILPYLVAHHGGLSFLKANLPASHWQVERRQRAAGGARLVRDRADHPGRAGVLPALLRGAVRRSRVTASWCRSSSG
jgi:hypothetical protein